MGLNLIKNENIIIVYLRGRLDIHKTEEIEKEINLLLSKEKSSHFIFNLKDVEYVSSSGLRLFVSVITLLRQRNKQLILCSLNHSVRKILDVVELNGLFRIFKTENEAVEFLSKE